MSDAQVLRYEDLAQLPIGTVIASRERYWQAIRRHHVKTTSNTWAVFFHLPTSAEVDAAVRERQNNVSPGPLGMLAEVVEVR